MALDTGGRGLSLFEAARRMGVPFTEEVEPESRWATVNGLRLHYLDWGNPHLPPMLLLHGSSQTAHSWDFVALAFRHRYHCMALDQRGHGDSDWDPAGDYGLLPMVEDLEGFCRALELPPAVIVGLSMGGRNAYTFGALHPHRVRALVVVDSGPEMRREGQQQMQRFRSLPDEVDSLEEFVERVHQFNPRRPKEQLWGSLRHNVRQLPNGKWTWKYDRRLRDPGHRRDLRTPEELWGYLRRVQAPTLVVLGGESDMMAQDVGERMRQALPRGYLAVVPRAGHLVPGDNPVGFIGAVQEFLDGLGERA